MSRLAALAMLLPAVALADPPPSLEPPPAMEPAPLAPPPAYAEPPPPLARPGQPVRPPEPLKIVPPPALGPGVVRLHLEAPEALQLKRDSGPPVTVYDDAGPHQASGVVCTAPCDAVIDARSGTRFAFGGGSGTPDSSAFSLSSSSGELVARVHPGSKGLRLASALVGGLGGLMAYVGVVWMANEDQTLRPSQRDEVHAIGRATLVSGGAVLLAAGGLYLLSRTTYDLQPAAPQHR